MGHLADQEIGGLHALRGQYVENGGGVGRDRAIVEGEHHLVVLERQRGPVLDGADQGKLGRIDGDGAAGADRVRIARA